MSEREVSDELRRVLARMDADYAPLGRVEHQQYWECEDGWHVAYTTSKVIGGQYDGKFLVQAFKPVGKGARSGKAEEFVQVYARPFAKRNVAKARAIDLYKIHSPKWAAKHDRSGTK